jgi:hypothetical protein
MKLLRVEMWDLRGKGQAKPVVENGVSAANYYSANRKNLTQRRKDAKEEYAFLLSRLCVFA